MDLKIVYEEDTELAEFEALNKGYQVIAKQVSNYKRIDGQRCKFYRK